jgi:hypothetical protein
MANREMTTIRIANTQAFWGDSTDAAGNLLALEPGLDYLTLDYLAEVTMSILAKQKQKDPNLGFARDFLDVIASLITHWKNGSQLKIITNAGGLNPDACAQSAARVLGHAGLSHLKVAAVSGDDVLVHLRAKPDTKEFCHLETGKPLTEILDKLVTANAYIGAEPVTEALRQGAQIIVTGRVADPSLAVAPCAHEFDWNSSNFDRIAAATIAGHLIECGTQVTGGISTDWLSLDDPHRLGFPIVEIAPDGSTIVTKSSNTSGVVNLRTVKEQLLYEIGDPDNYISPDAIVSFLGLRLDDLGNNRVRITGAKGRPTTDFFKVTATYRAGFKASGTLTIIGRDAVLKARRVGEVIREKLKLAGVEPQHYLAEVIGSGDTMPGVLPRRDDLFEVVLRVGAMDERKEVVEKFARELIPMVTAGPQGTTGYFDGRPTVREVFGYWPCLIRRELVKTDVTIMEPG